MLLLCVFVGSMKAQETLTVYEGSNENVYVPFRVKNFASHTKSQYVIPAKDLSSMNGGTIYCIMYYTKSTSIPHTTVNKVEVCMKEVDDTSISQFATFDETDKVYEGTLEFTSLGTGGTVLITLDKPYVYKGGNLLIGTRNIKDKNGDKNDTNTTITFYGQKVNGAAVTGCASLESNINVNPAAFIPKTTFLYVPRPVVTDLTTTPTSATVEWTGKVSSYQLRHGKIAFFDDFENGMDRWKVVRNGGGNEGSDWHCYQKAKENETHRGTHCAMSRSWNDTPFTVDNWLISPEVTLGGTLSFWVRDDGHYHEHYEVYVSTTTNDISAFELLASPGNASAEWQEVAVDLRKYEGKKGYIAIRNQDTDQDYLLIDDLGIYPEENAWTTVDGATSPYTISHLDTDTSYGIQVRSVNANNETSNWVSIGFITEGNPIPVDVTVTSTTKNTASVSWTGYGKSYEVRYRKSPARIYLSQGFEEGLGAWTLENGVDGTSCTLNEAAHHSGNVGFAFHWTTNPPQYLISPEMTAVAEGTTLQFYYKNRHTGYTESFAVGYSSTTNATDAFTFGEEKSIKNNTWTLFSEAVPAGTRYICIKHTSYDKNYLFVDDIIVAKALPGTDNWKTVSGITATTMSIKGLEPNTQYDFQVRSLRSNKDSDGTSEWTEQRSFTTDLEQLVLRDNDAAVADKNTDIISRNNGQVVNVTLSGHTFHKDGAWNTICLPFDVTISGSTLDGATVRELTSAVVTGTTLSLTFGNEVTTLQAGRPYIIKWANDTDMPTITDPKFAGVMIDATDRRYDNGVSGKGYVSFAGQYEPFEIVANNAALNSHQGHQNEILLLVANNTIGYSKELRTTANGKALHCFGGHFYVPATDGKATTRSINVDYGDGTTAIIGIHDDSATGTMREGWYTLDGRRLPSAPTKAGLYINNGQKVTIQ